MNLYSTEKQALRKSILAARSKLSREQIAEQSAQLSKHLFASNLWRDAKIILAFSGTKGEPDTREILQACWSEEKRLFLPRVVDRRKLSFHRVDTFDSLEAGVFGIQEPRKDAELWPGHLQSLIEPQGIILVPGLGFDHGGSRIGYGKGYYDQFLTPYRNCGRLVGLCWSTMLSKGLNSIPTDVHDISVDWLLTERGLVGAQVNR